MSLFGSVFGFFLRGASPILGMVAVSSFLYLIVDHIHIPRWWDKKTHLIGRKSPERITRHECPYDYLREIYGKHHWKAFVHKLSPALHNDDPAKYSMVLEIMDAIHLCLMLVDDVSARDLLFSVFGCGTDHLITSL
jgi:geranylgeranyldiphosphate transferase